MEVNRGLFIDCLDLMEVNKIKKHILGFTQLNITHLGPHFWRNEDRIEYIILCLPLQLLIIVLLVLDTLISYSWQ